MDEYYKQKQKKKDKNQVNLNFIFRDTYITDKYNEEKMRIVR